MGFQDASWSIFMSSLVILVHRILRYSQTHRQTDAKPLPPLLPSASVTDTITNRYNNDSKIKRAPHSQLNKGLVSLHQDVPGYVLCHVALSLSGRVYTCMNCMQFMQVYTRPERDNATWHNNRPTHAAMFNINRSTLRPETRLLEDGQYNYIGLHLTGMACRMVIDGWNLCIAAAMAEVGLVISSSVWLHAETTALSASSRLEWRSQNTPAKRTVTLIWIEYMVQWSLGDVWVARFGTERKGCTGEFVKNSDALYSVRKSVEIL